MTRFSMGSIAGIFVTSILILIMASIFLPFLIPLIGNGSLLVNESIAEPWHLFFHFLSDPNLVWIKVLLLVPLVMVWFIVSW